MHYTFLNFPYFEYCHTSALSYVLQIMPSLDHWVEFFPLQKIIVKTPWNIWKTKDIQEIE